jgi:phosphopantothenoylcysteine decarboxylase/phosphopantothenate--cysteine ligase
MDRPKHIILGVTGSIAAVKSVSTARALRDRGFAVRAALTHSARQVITPQALRAVTDEPPYVDMWWPDDEEGGERHVQWAAWTEAILIAPATASAIGALAHGLYDNCVTLIAANLSPSRWLLAPAMAESMWRQEAVQTNLRQLAGWGAHIIDPVVGNVASGDVGRRMAEPDTIAAAVDQRWESLDGKSDPRQA